MRFRSGGWVAFVAVAGVLLGGTLAQAAIIGTATLIKNPPGVAFGAPEAALPAPWVSYRLSVASDSGEIIQAVQANIVGQLHQRWSDADEDTVLEPTPNPAAVNFLNGDSHLAAPAGSLFGSGPSEDNSLAGSPLPNTTTRFYGVGSFLQAAWALPAASVGTSADVAYIVIPAGTEPNLNISVRLADPTGGDLGSLTLDSFFDFGPDNLPPIVDDGGLIPVQLDTNNPPALTTAMHQFVATDDAPLSELVWALDSFTGPGVLNGATLDASGKLSWVADGSQGGLYTAVVHATDAGGLADSGSVNFLLTVPEPTSIALFGLALVGFAGFRRT